MEVLRPQRAPNEVQTPAAAHHLADEERAVAELQFVAAAGRMPVGLHDVRFRQTELANHGAGVELIGV